MSDDPAVEPRGEAAAGGVAVAVPREHLCARCGYPSGLSGSRVCPECGWAATVVELTAETARREAVAHWEEGGRLRAAQRWACVVAVYGLGAALLGRSVVFAASAIVLLTPWLALSWQLGAIGAWRCRADRRDYLRAIWGRSLWILHLPWLVAPVFVVAAAFVGLIDRWAGRAEGEVYSVTVVAGLWMWLLALPVVFFVWWRRRMTLLAAGGYRLGRADATAFLAGLVVLGGAAIVGFAAGILVAAGVAEWLGMDGSLTSG